MLSSGQMAYRTLVVYSALVALGAVLLGVIVVFIRVLTLSTPGEPEVPPEQPYYVVKPGDALAAIAQRTGVPEDELLELNPDVDPLALAPNQRLRLRASVPLPPQPNEPRPRPPVPPDYVIRRGDTLGEIATKTGVPVFRILDLNRNIKATTLKPGTRIKLRRSPVPSLQLEW